MRGRLRRRATAGLIACALAAPAGAATVGLVPDPDPARHEQLVRGARLALEAGGSRLVVGRQAGHWNGLTAVIEELIGGEGAEVLVAPVDRRAAHLVAQIATRRHLPAVATSAADGLGATGSWWLVTCEWEAGASAPLAERLGRPPSQWEAAGWSAARLAERLAEGPSAAKTGPGSAWRNRLPRSCLAAHPAKKEIYE